MEFEIGPWTSFGKEILDQIDELINGNLITDESDLLGNKICLSFHQDIYYSLDDHSI